MIESFADTGTADIFFGQKTSRARKALPQNLHEIGRRKLTMIDVAETLESLGFPPSNMLESLSGDRKGQYSIRINQKYRVCCVWSDRKVKNVEIVNYHEISIRKDAYVYS